MDRSEEPTVAVLVSRRQAILQAVGLIGGVGVFAVAASPHEALAGEGRGGEDEGFGVGKGKKKRKSKKKKKKKRKGFLGLGG